MYSQEDLLLYAYNETELTESVLIQQSIDGDPLVEDEYQEIVASIDVLNKVLFEPDQETMDRLMERIKSEV
jgi:hypothetical protein